MTETGLAADDMKKPGRPAWLYHGSRVPERLSELAPSCFEQTRNGRIGRWLFATHRLDQATLFACPLPPVGSFSMALDCDEGVLAHFRAESEAEMAVRPVNGRIYAVAADAFEQVEDFPREWVSGCAVQSRDFEAVTGWDQSMKRGVQFFCMAAAADHAIFDPKSRRHLFAGAIDRAWLAACLACESRPLVWLNQAMHINPDSELEALLRG